MFVKKVFEEAYYAGPVNGHKNPFKKMIKCKQKEHEKN
jgi:hypothetical protein